MKVIFLDVDGVLNWSGTTDNIGGYIGLDALRIERFNRIIDAHPDAKIVISSTWRSGMHGVYASMDKDPQALPSLLARRGLRGEVIGHTVISYGHRERGDEIRDWLEVWISENPDNSLMYVILDDDTSGMRSCSSDERDLRDNHVVTDWTGDPNYPGEEGGLQDRHVEQAIATLRPSDEGEVVA